MAGRSWGRSGFDHTEDCSQPKRSRFCNTEQDRDRSHGSYRDQDRDRSHGLYRDQDRDRSHGSYRDQDRDRSHGSYRDHDRDRSHGSYRDQDRDRSHGSFRDQDRSSHFVNVKTEYESGNLNEVERKYQYQQRRDSGMNPDYTNNGGNQSRMPNLRTETEMTYGSPREVKKWSQYESKNYLEFGNQYSKPDDTISQPKFSKYDGQSLLQYGHDYHYERIKDSSNKANFNKDDKIYHEHGSGNQFVKTDSFLSNAGFGKYENYNTSQYIRETRYGGQNQYDNAKQIDKDNQRLNQFDNMNYSQHESRYQINKGEDSSNKFSEYDDNNSSRYESRNQYNRDEDSLNQRFRNSSQYDEENKYSTESTDYAKEVYFKSPCLNDRNDEFYYNQEKESYNDQETSELCNFENQKRDSFRQPWNVHKNDTLTLHGTGFKSESSYQNEPHRNRFSFQTSKRGAYNQERGALSQEGGHQNREGLFKYNAYVESSLSNFSNEVVSGVSSQTRDNMSGNCQESDTINNFGSRVTTILNRMPSPPAGNKFSFGNIFLTASIPIGNDIDQRPNKKSRLFRRAKRKDRRRDSNQPTNTSASAELRINRVLEENKLDKQDNEGEKDEEEMNDSDDDMCTNIVVEQGDGFTPDSNTIAKFKYFPPSAEEMGELFKNLVIVFFLKKKNIVERNPFVAMCESFRRSSNYTSLTIEDGYEAGNKKTKYCTVRWRGILMGRGVGTTGIFKEARLAASVEILNKLAMSCYILKGKESFFSKEATQSFIEAKDPPDFVRIVTAEEVPDFKTGQSFIKKFFEDDNNRELIFNQFPQDLKNWAIRSSYEVHCPKRMNVLRVSILRSSAYWRDKILASGKMEDERYELIAPLGIGKCYFENTTVEEFVFGRNDKIKIEAFKLKGKVPVLSTIYAPNNTGLNIGKAKVPWERGRFGRSKKNRKNKYSNKKKIGKKFGTKLLGN